MRDERNSCQEQTHGSWTAPFYAGSAFCPRVLPSRPTRRQHRISSVCFPSAEGQGHLWRAGSWSLSWGVTDSLVPLPKKRTKRVHQCRHWLLVGRTSANPYGVLAVMGFLFGNIHRSGWMDAFVHVSFQRISNWNFLISHARGYFYRFCGKCNY